MHRVRQRPFAWAVALSLGLIASSCTSGDSVPSASTTTTETTASSGTSPGSTAVPSESTSSTMPPIELRPYGGEAVIGVDLEPPTLNPLLPGGDSQVLDLIGNTYLVGVYEVDGDTLQLTPDVVAELPTVGNGGILINEDGTETIRYEIRSDAVWADGTPISGDDFEFTYETIMNPDHPVVRQVYEDILPDSIEVGPKTFEFTLAFPTLEAERLFGTLIPKHDVGGSDFTSDWNDTMWMSGGPFQFEQWRKGDTLVMTRNPNYWKSDASTDQQLPYLDRVLFRFIPDAAALLDSFAARDVDVIEPSAGIDTLAGLRALEGQGTRLDVVPGHSWEHLSFQFGENRTERNPGTYNEFLEYRQAVAHAIDRQRIVDELFDGAVAPMDSYVEAYIPALSTGAWSQYPYDPERAAELLEQLCARADTDCDTNPPRAVFTTNSNNELRTRLGVLLDEMLESVGIDFEPQLDEPLVFFGETLDAGNYDLASWAWVGAPELTKLVSQHRFFDPAEVPPRGQNLYRWGTAAVTDAVIPIFEQGASSVIDEHTARFTELTALMDSTVDRTELTAHLAETEQILADQVVFIPLYQEPDAGAVWADEIGAYSHTAADTGDTWNVEQWFRADLATGP